MILSITEEKSGMVVTSKTESPSGCDSSEDIGGLSVNSNGLVGEQGRVGLWMIALMREPSGTSGGGSAGGRSGGGSAGGRFKAASSEPGSTTDGANANEMEGVRACRTGAESPVCVGIWSDPTHQEGPYPSHSSVNASSFLNAELRHDEGRLK